MRDPDLDFDMAIDLANRILAGEEVAEALAGTGLVVDMSPQPAHIAEIETSQGVVEVPVAEAPQFAAAAPAVDPSKFYTAGQFHLLKAYRAVGEVEGLLEDYLHSLPEAEVKKIAKAERVGKGTKEELISALVHEAGRQNNKGMVFLTPDGPTNRSLAFDAIHRAKDIAHTAKRREQTAGLREGVQQALARLSPSDIKQVAAHYGVDLRRTPADQRVQQITERTVGDILGSRAVRGDYEEDEEARVRERDEQQQWMIAQYREREGLPPVQASGVEGIEGAKRAGVEILSTMPPERRGGSPKILMVRVPPGSYWIGDPSASIPPKQFDDLVGGSDVVGTVDGYPVVAFSLENGDVGDYRDLDGHEYPIDSGMLGIVDARIAIDEEDASIRKKIMRLVRFNKPTACAFEFDGSRWIFGNVVIKDRDADTARRSRRSR